MLKKLLPVIVVVLILGAAIGGYWARPLVDFRFVDYPVIQDAALYSVQMYKHIAERLADYPVCQEDIELVALGYADIETKIRDAGLLEDMDWRYDLVREIEAEFPFVRVINIEETESAKAVIDLYLDETYLASFDPLEALIMRLEVVAKSVLLTGAHYPSHLLEVRWVAVSEYECLGERCVRGTVSVGITAPADSFMNWARVPRAGLYPELEFLIEVEGAGLYIDNMWTPFILVTEELPRLSDDPAPWDQEWFYED